MLHLAESKARWQAHKAAVTPQLPPFSNERHASGVCFEVDTKVQGKVQNTFKKIHSEPGFAELKGVSTGLYNFVEVQTMTLGADGSVIKLPA